MLTSITPQKKTSSFIPSRAASSTQQLNVRNKTTLCSAKPSSCSCLSALTCFISDLFYSIFQFIKKCFCGRIKEVPPPPKSFIPSLLAFAAKEKYQGDAIQAFVEDILRRKILSISKEDALVITPEFYTWAAENFPELQEIDINNVEISERSICSFAKACSCLKSIKITFPLSDECLQEMGKNCPQLEKICFRISDQVTAKGIEALARCKKLKTIGFIGDSISEEISLALKKYLPALLASEDQMTNFHPVVV